MYKTTVTQEAKSPSFLLSAQNLLQRKCGCGNHTVAGGECAECAKNKVSLQRKLAIGTSNDPLEQEADRVADQVLSAPARTSVGTAPLRVQCFTGQPIRQDGTAPASVDRVLASSGRPLEPMLRHDMEQRFGHDFSGVRVHSGAEAEQSAHDVNANAYTVGYDLVFGAGKFAPGTREGRRLLAHELTHVVQQESARSNNPPQPSNQKTAGRQVMRSLALDSTVKICHRELTSTNIKVSQGGLRVVLPLKELDIGIPDCKNHKFWVTLTKSVDWGFDDEIATCEGDTGGTRSFSFGNLSSGIYYLTIARAFDNPYCCIEGDILVFDERVNSDSSICIRDKDPSAVDIVHGALDIAGFIPVLGAIPDGINAGIYVAEGDWANAGLSAVAMVPAWGDGVKLGAIAGKTAIKISEKAAIRLGEEGIAKGLKEVKAASKVEKGALEATEEAGKLAKAESETAEGIGKAEKETAEEVGQAEKETAGKKKDEKKGEKGKWGCRDVRCNVYPDPRAQPPNNNCPERVIGEVPYIFPSFTTACVAAQQAANLLVPRGCIKRHCNCNTKCTKK